MRLGSKRVSHVLSNSSLLEVDSRSAAEERVVFQQGRYMFS